MTIINKVIKTPWEWTKEITEKKSVWEDFDESSQKKFSGYMVNRFMSMKLELVNFVNDLQKLELDKKNLYNVYKEILPRKKMWFKYIKADKTTKYEPWLTDILCKYFEVSKKEVISYIELLLGTKKGKLELRDILEKYGTETKLIKKLKI
jgi:hypothetical protein|tara:strand:+ start:165 stop:614 length:450 start_codon:yes stop_codon:yes gene_type:complete